MPCTTRNRRTFMTTALAATAAAAGLPAAVQAQATWPQRPIKIYIPFAAGGNTDIVARLIAPELGKILGQPVVVENRPGASGNIAADGVAKAQPDGYSLLMGTVGTQAINGSIFRKLPYDPLKDFAQITLVASVPNVLVVNPANPAKTVAELVKNGQGKPLSFASSGAGTAIHLSGELFKSITKLDLTHVPYRGSSLALTDLLGGQVDLIFDNLPAPLPFIQSGKLRALAVTTAKRTVQLPDVPTMAEAGFPNFELGSWFGLLAPAGTPPAIVEKINAAVQKIIGQPSFEKRLVELGAERVAKGPAEFKAFNESEYRKWAAVVKTAGATMD